MAAAVNASETTTGNTAVSLLTCTLASKEKHQVYSFRADESKKSAFWLDPSSSREIQGPAECAIERVPVGTSSSSFWMIGGFQIISNAKMIEVHLDGEYLTTCRGIPSSNGDHQGFYKAMYVIPGGPRPVERAILLKLLSLKPDHTDTACLIMMKLTARVPDVENQQQQPEVASEPSVATSTTTSTPLGGEPGTSIMSSPPSHPLLPETATPSSSESMSDMSIQSAMAALSMMMRCTEERVVQSTAREVQKEVVPLLVQTVQAQMQQVTATMLTQLQFQNQLLLQQQKLLAAQQFELQELRAEQSKLKSLVECQVLERLEVLSTAAAVRNDGGDGKRESPTLPLNGDNGYNCITPLSNNNSCDEEEEEEQWHGDRSDVVDVGGQEQIAIEVVRSSEEQQQHQKDVSIVSSFGSPTDPSAGIVTFDACGIDDDDNSTYGAEESSSDECTTTTGPATDRDISKTNK